MEQVNQNKFNKNNNIKANYCSKCLSVLNGKSVKDVEGREFCCVDCRKEYFAEARKEFDCQFREWRTGGR